MRRAASALSLIVCVATGSLAQCSRAVFRCVCRRVRASAGPEATQAHLAAVGESSALPRWQLTVTNSQRIVPDKKETEMAQQDQDWTKPAAMALPKGGLFKDKVEQGRYGPI